MLSILAAATITAGGLVQANSAYDNDVRCVVTLMHLANLAEEKDASGVSTAALYFLGKVDGRNPDIDLVAAADIIQSSPDYDLTGEATRCASELEARQSGIEALEDRIVANAGL